MTVDRLVLIALGFAAFSGTAARAADLVVRYDQSQLLRLSRPVSEVIVGNPSIADVAVQSASILVVTGKTFGITNIIALDQDKKVIEDKRVIVERDERRVVNLHKGSARWSYACTPDCQPTITIGDDKEYFEEVKKQSEGKTGFSNPDGKAAQ